MAVEEAGLSSEDARACVWVARALLFVLHAVEVHKDCCRGGQWSEQKSAGGNGGASSETRIGASSQTMRGGSGKAPTAGVYSKRVRSDRLSTHKAGPVNGSTGECKGA